MSPEPDTKEEKDNYDTLRQSLLEGMKTQAENDYGIGEVLGVLLTVSGEVLSTLPTETLKPSLELITKVAQSRN